MSVLATSWVWSLDLPATVKLVALAVADHADERGICWPSQAHIATKTGLDRRTVVRHLKELEDRKVLSRMARFTDDGDRDTTRYTLPKLSSPSPQGVGAPRQGVGAQCPNGRGVVPPRVGAQCPSESSIEPSLNLKTYPSPDGEEQESTIYSAAFEQFWKAYPKKKGKGDAFRAWKTTTKYRPPDRDVIAAVQRASLSEQWRKDGGQFIPYPATWLRSHGWLDEDPSAGTGSSASTGLSTDELEAWRNNPIFD